MLASEANKLSITDIKKYLLANWFDGDDSSKYCNGGDEETMVMHRLVQICEKYEQGLIIELPVPIGTHVYHIDSMYTNLHPNGIFRIREAVFDYGYLIHWGKTVYATREEAEKRLEELRNEN